MMKRRSLQFIALIFLPAFLLVFQNCSQVALEDNVIEKASVNPPLLFQSKFCSQARFSEGAQSKFVFILDQSASNFGNWSSRSLGGQILYSWDPSLATDQKGDRFNAIKHFLESCGDQKGNQFALISFSSSAGVIKNGNLSCDNLAFTTKDNILSQMDEIKSVQKEDENWYNRWLSPAYLSEAQPDSLMSSVTNYLSANKCLEKLIVEDLQTKPSGSSDKYNVFFISDGMPQDKNGTGCNLSSLNEEQKTQCYLDSNLQSLTITRTAAISKGSTVQVQGIYYGHTGEKSPEVLSALSKEGGTTNVTLLKSFGENQNALCDLVSTKNSVYLSPDSYATINLTGYRKQGKMIADSDMDGIPDEEEVLLGFDPQNPRSQVDDILDGICIRLGGVEKCKEKRAQINCNPDKWDNLGLNDCDVKILGLDSLPGYLSGGIDADQDGMPDFIEILKGTDPAVRDMTKDPDGDGVSNRDEILRGTDPYFYDSFTPNELINLSSAHYSSTSNSTQCKNGEWTLSMTQLQFTKTLPVVDFPLELSPLTHPRNAQVLLTMYRLSPLNSANSLFEYYGQFVRVTATGRLDEVQLTAIPESIHPDDFQLLGKGYP